MADRDSDAPDPRSLIRQYPPLGDAIGALRTLAEINPGLLDDILALAMVMGIHAGVAKYRRDEVLGLVRADMEQGMETLLRDRYSSPTYGDLQSPAAHTLRPGWQDKPRQG